MYCFREIEDTGDEPEGARTRVASPSMSAKNVITLIINGLLIVWRRLYPMRKDLSSIFI
jgi:hypothetical protein